MKSLLLVLCLGVTSFAVAHSGGTDSSGCHVKKSTGERHCH